MYRGWETPGKAWPPRQENLGSTLSDGSWFIPPYSMCSQCDHSHLLHSYHPGLRHCHLQPRFLECFLTEPLLMHVLVLNNLSIAQWPVIFPIHSECKSKVFQWPTQPYRTSLSISCQPPFLLFSLSYSLLPSFGHLLLLAYSHPYPSHLELFFFLYYLFSNKWIYFFFNVSAMRDRIFLFFIYIYQAPSSIPGIQ